MKAEIMFVKIEGNDETIATALRTLGTMLLGDAANRAPALPASPPAAVPQLTDAHSASVARRTRIPRKPAVPPSGRRASSSAPAGAEAEEVEERTRSDAGLLELEGSDETFTVKQLAKRLQLTSSSVYSKLAAMKKFKLIWAIHGDHRFRWKGKEQ